MNKKFLPFVCIFSALCSKRNWKSLFISICIRKLIPSLWSTTRLIRKSWISDDFSFFAHHKILLLILAIDVENKKGVIFTKNPVNGMYLWWRAVTSLWSIFYKTIVIVPHAMHISWCGCLLIWGYLRSRRYQASQVFLCYADRWWRLHKMWLGSFSAVKTVRW